MPLPLDSLHYRKLLADISSLYDGAKKALVEAYWKIGRRIVEVEQKGEIRAAHGSRLISNLSADLTKKLGSGFSTDNLWRMRKFYLQYPKTAPSRFLDWTHFTELTKVEDVKKRSALEKRTFEDELSVKQVRELVRREKVRAKVAERLKPTDHGNGKKPENMPLHTGSSSRDHELLVPPIDLKLFTYKKAEIATAGKELRSGSAVLDLGFYVYLTVTRNELKTVIITDNPSFTYAACVERVVDGDTLVLVIEAGFGVQIREKVRLRGIDTPELGTPEGEAARRFVSRYTPPGMKVLVRSSRSDLYGRFVADLWFNDKAGEQQYLNNLLLERGYAIRLRNYA